MPASMAMWKAASAWASSRLLLRTGTRRRSQPEERPCWWEVSLMANSCGSCALMKGRTTPSVPDLSTAGLNLLVGHEDGNGQAGVVAHAVVVHEGEGGRATLGPGRNKRLAGLRWVVVG